MTLGKIFTFDAAHYLPGHATCGQTHGHTWRVEVILTEKGEDTLQDIMFDFKSLSEIVEPILGDLDHTLLNTQTPLYYPSCENLARFLKKQISRHKSLKEFIITIKVQEGEGGYAIA